MRVHVALIMIALAAICSATFICEVSGESSMSVIAPAPPITEAQDREHVYRWNGEYFGFILRGRFYRSDAEYLGWIESDGDVWRANGSYLGELVDGSYVLRLTSRAIRARRAARARPATPSRGARPASRAGRARRSGWTDALDEYPPATN